MSNAAVKKARPRNLSLRALLFDIRLPLPGWVSILHRVSGAFLFFGTIWLLFILDRSLASAKGFEAASRYVQLPLVKLALLALIWAFCHHLCAGVRFLALDLHLGLEKEAARRSSAVVIAASLLLTVLFGTKLW
jgi:succinate dehydrogenase / fumarate reductase cytochrome b subunit